MSSMTLYNKNCYFLITVKVDGIIYTTKTPRKYS